MLFYLGRSNYIFSLDAVLKLAESLRYPWDYLTSSTKEINKFSAFVRHHTFFVVDAKFPPS